MHGNLAVPPPFPALFSPRMAALPWLRHGFSTRQGGVSTAFGREGDLNLGRADMDPPENLARNREIFLDAIGACGPGGRYPLRTLSQVHSARTHRLDENGACAAAEGDGLISAAPGIAVGVLTADCVPVLVADTRRRVVAAFHAGWRGTVGRIVERGIARMQAELGCDPADMVAAVGPAIGSCCYQVGVEVRESFRREFGYGDELLRPDSEGRWRLDLAGANRRQLKEAGLAVAAVERVGGCTACAPQLFFSHRASGGSAGRMLSAIAVAG